MQTDRIRPCLATIALLLCTTLSAYASPGTPPLAPSSTSSDAAFYEAADLVDGVFLQRWLLCGPFPNPGTLDPGGNCSHDASCQGFFTDFLAPTGGETGAAPQDDLQVLGPDQKTRRWHAVTTLGGRVYFEDYMSPSEFQTGYAACWINASRDEDRLFGIGGDDGVNLWVNGEQVFRFHAERDLKPDEHYIRLPLKAGRNLVLLKVDNGTGRWGFSLRPVDNTAAVKEVINRLREVLRFDCRQTEQGFEVTLGDPLVLGNLWDLPEAEIRIVNRGGETVQTFVSPLCRPVQLAFSDYPDEDYTLEGKVLWPYRGRTLIPGMLHRGDLRAEVETMAKAPAPALPPGRLSEAYQDLVQGISQEKEFSGYSEEPFAFLRLKAGLTTALQTTLNLQNARSPYDLIFPRQKQIGTSRTTPVTITGNWTLQVADSLFEATADDAAFRRWTDITAGLTGAQAGRVYVFALESGPLNAPTPEMEAADSEFLAPAAVLRDQVPADREGYAMRVQHDAVIIAGRTAAGAHYGLDSLLQLLAAAKSGSQELTVDEGTIIDAPVYPTRASVLPLEQFDDAFKNAINHLEDLRFNLVFLPSSLYANMDSAENRTTLADAYQYCRAHFVEPLPLIETFGADTLVANLDPSLLEGTYVEELPVTVDELRRAHLPYDRILDSEATPIRLRTEKGYAILRKDRDFVIESSSPPVIQLKGQAPVQTGDTLLLTADLVDLSQATTPACCPSDTRTWLMLEKVLGEVYTLLKPVGIHLGHAGAGYLNKDSRCRERGMPNALLLAEAVQKGTDIVRKLDPRTQVYIWGEHFNPLQRALELDGVKAAGELPKDITVVDNHERAESYYDVWRIKAGLDFFDQFGLDTMGVVGSDPLAVAEYGAMKREHPNRFRGLLYYPVPGKESGSYAAAQAGWEGVTLLGSLEYDSAPTDAASP